MTQFRKWFPVLFVLLALIVPAGAVYGQGAKWTEVESPTRTAIIVSCVDGKGAYIHSISDPKCRKFVLGAIEHPLTGEAVDAIWHEKFIWSHGTLLVKKGTPVLEEWRITGALRPDPISTYDIGSSQPRPAREYRPGFGMSLAAADGRLPHCYVETSNPPVTVCDGQVIDSNFGSVGLAPHELTQVLQAQADPAVHHTAPTLCGHRSETPQASLILIACINHDELRRLGVPSLETGVSTQILVHLREKADAVRVLLDKGRITHEHRYGDIWWDPNQRVWAAMVTFRGVFSELSEIKAMVARE